MWPYKKYVVIWLELKNRFQQRIYWIILNILIISNCISCITNMINVFLTLFISINPFKDSLTCRTRCLGVPIDFVATVKTNAPDVNVQIIDGWRWWWHYVCAYTIPFYLVMMVFSYKEFSEINGNFWFEVKYICVSEIEDPSATGRLVAG